MFKKNTLIHKVSSKHGNYRVIDAVYNGRPSRMLFGDDRSPQSGMALDNNPELLFGYNQRFMEIIQSVQPRKVLVIGGGAFSLPMAIVERFSDTIVDVVEIDPILPELAERFFGFKSNKRIGVFVQDGREFIETTKNTYDLIVVDAFSGMDIPRTLLSRQAAKLYSSALSPNGLVAINFISAYNVAKPDLAHQLISTFETEFIDVNAYPTERSSSVFVPDNLVLVASKKESPRLDYLQAVSLSSFVRLDAEVIQDD